MWLLNPIVLAIVLTGHPVKWEHGGKASFYSHKFQNRVMANGERYDAFANHAAHKTLPFNTIVLIRNPKNGKTVKVRITDRGPFVRGRNWDLSWWAAKELGMLQSGVISVEYRVISSKNT